MSFDYRSESFYILFILHRNFCELNKLYLFYVVENRMFNQIFMSFQHQLIEIAKIFRNMQYRRVLQNEMSRIETFEKSHINRIDVCRNTNVYDWSSCELHHSQTTTYEIRKESFGDSIPRIIAHKCGKIAVWNPFCLLNNFSFNLRAKHQHTHTHTHCIG